MEKPKELEYFVMKKESFKVRPLITNVDEVSTEAIQLYYAIFEAYLDVGVELLGESVLEDQIVPRMKFYLESFVPEADLSDDDLVEFVNTFKENVEEAIFEGTVRLTFEDAWKLRAIIFGFENAFLEILGENAVRKYVFPKVAEYLIPYLPDILTKPNVDLKNKLRQFLDYLKTHKFIRAGKIKLKKDGFQFSANHCIFAGIHDSPAYKDGKTRFCPWGMIATAIAAHHQKTIAKNVETKFTYRGSITYLEMVEED